MNFFAGFLLLMKNFAPGKQVELTFTSLTSEVFGRWAAVKRHEKLLKTADRYRKVKLGEQYLSISNYLLGFLCVSCHKW